MGNFGNNSSLFRESRVYFTQLTVFNWPLFHCRRARRTGFYTFIFIFCLYILSQIKFSDPYYDPLPDNQIEPNCSSLFSDATDPTVFRAAETWKIPKHEIFTDNQLNQLIENNCDNFLNQKKYFLNSPINEEINFPIAFSILIYQSASQVERLLRTIYRPWNYYCFHIDLKSDEYFVKSISSLVNCLNNKYNNIFITSDRVNVQWGEITVLTADLNCMKELIERYNNWKYLINLTGQEFPLKTNAELVKILQAFKGANNVDGTYKYRDELRIPNVKMPFPLVWFKGSVHITVNRKFVEYIFNSPNAKFILGALTEIVPDEQFFTTLNYNAQLRIPGSFIGDPDDFSLGEDLLTFFITRYKNRGLYPCLSGQKIRGLCIWGVGDLPKLITVPHLFANKFFEEFQPITLRCLEKWYYDKVKKETITDVVAINETFYGSLPFVQYRFMPTTN